MGGGNSTPEPKELKPEEPKLLSEPWRNVTWSKDKRNDLKQYLLDYKPSIDSVPEARILLIGAITAGKSSFFNSINSIFRDNMTSQAKAGYKGTSLTLKYRTYKVKDGRGGRPLSFLLCDTMGLEADKNGGVKIEDIESILKGCIKDNYEFNPANPMKAEDCQACSSVTLKDKIHCVAYVIDASSFAILPEGTKTKIDEIRERINFTDVPLMVLLTHVDEACPQVDNNLKNVYRSCYIKSLIERTSKCLGIPMLNVLPVKNYSHETELNDNCDILLLTAMKQMLNFADNYFDECEEDRE